MDLFAGTSTGGILALGLAHGMSPNDLVGLYRDNGERIFRTRDAWDTVALESDEVYRADYGTESLAEVLRPHFGATTLGELSRRVLIPTFDLDAPRKDDMPRQWRPKFLHNYPGSTSDGAVAVLDAALRTSAAPTYFPSYEGFVDGGVVANNPSMCAVAKAVKSGVDPDDIFLLSIGTGYNAHRIPGSSLDWGQMQWGLRILKLVMEGTSGVARYQCQQLLGARYHRVQIELPEIIELDETGKIGRMIEIADDRSLSDAEAYLQSVASKLM